MHVPLSSIPPGTILYPESDGKPMADNTKQARWIHALYGNLTAKFARHDDVFIAADNLWYPVEGEPTIRIAPDVYLVFGRPKGDRGSYQQWREGDVPLTVAFEILSPSNTPEEMDDKLLFYEQYGVEEYYEYNPETNRLRAFVRRGDVLLRVWKLAEFVSPRLSIRFEMTEPEMSVFHSAGGWFLTFEQSELERQKADRRADDEKRRADKAELESSDLRQRIARIAELIDKALLGQATPDELAELQRLKATP